MINSQDHKPDAHRLSGLGNWTVRVLFLLVFGSLCGTYSSAQDKSAMAPQATPTPTYSESAPFVPTPEPTPKGGKIKKERPPKPEKPGTAANAGSQTIELQVLVKDRAGNTVPGLRPSDFSVFIDDQEQQIVSVEDKQPLNVLFAVDTSSSAIYGLEGITAFIKQEIERFRPEDKISILRFNNEWKLLIDSSSDQATLGKALKKLGKGSSTAVYQTVGDILEDKLATRSGIPTVILISDGIDNASVRTRSNALAAAWHSLVPFVVLYIDSTADDPFDPKKYSGQGSDLIIHRSNPNGVNERKVDAAVGRGFLIDLYSSTGGIGYLFKPKSPGTLRLADILRSRYTVTIPKPAATAGQTHNLKVRVARPYLTVISKAFLVD